MFVVKYKKLLLWLTLVIVSAAFAVIFAFGLRPGIDFVGGTLIEVNYTTAPEKSAVTEAISLLEIGEPLVRQSDSDAGQGYLINVRDLSIEEQSKVETSLTTLGEGGNITRYTSIGPVIGAELQDKATWAIGLVLLITVIYVAFAFAGIGKPVSSWVYGFVTILILGHDVLIPFAAMSLLGHFVGAEVDILFMTAILTILGYSVNDTIVIFDRVREKLIQNRTEHRTKKVELGGIAREEVSYTLNKPFEELVGMAVSETMVRSINTSLTVLLALLALYFLGGVITQTFVLILIVGVIAGAYSSIFIASPILITYAEYLAKKGK